MKYKAGDIVLLNNGKTVYIVSVDEENKRYLVTDAEKEDNKVKYINESAIYMLVT